MIVCWLLLFSYEVLSSFICSDASWIVICETYDNLSCEKEMDVKFNWLDFEINSIELRVLRGWYHEYGISNNLKRDLSGSSSFYELGFLFGNCGVMIIGCRPISPSTSADTNALGLASRHAVATPLIVMAYGDRGNTSTSLNAVGWIKYRSGFFSFTTGAAQHSLKGGSRSCRQPQQTDRILFLFTIRPVRLLDFTGGLDCFGTR